MRTVSPVDAAWLVLESRDTPMHVGGLFEFTLPPNAPSDFLEKEFARMREPQTIPRPWNLRLVDGGPLVGPRLPLMRELRDVDLDYHVRHSALPCCEGSRAGRAPSPTAQKGAIPRRPGSVESARIIRRIPLTPSISAWCVLL